MRRLTITAALVLLALTGCTSDAELGDGEVTDRGALDTGKRVGGFDEPAKVGRTYEPPEDSPRFDCRIHGNERCGGPVGDMWASTTAGIPAWLLPEVD
ncbi:hypothetical protein CLV30_13141 [Haloactinopolyspora alba]|uniref:Uncharacterized protein n=1 Tax=Haloactinopolyspora alba TaxID=648780 RepID=A0A2P8D725_9ACTN|nr:hypothetical protein [Haloactinopolyspora alba]PSK93014.1 hypothetical protein CLV30_13141 [Haloactinopolyspora alba]